MKRLRRLRQRGAVAVEFALVLPLLLLLVLGGIDWGYYFFAGEIAANAAREGARAAALIRSPADPCSLTTGAPKIATNSMKAGGLIGGDGDTRLRAFDCTTDSCGGSTVANSCCQLTTIPGFSDPVVKVTVAFEARPCSMSLTGYLGSFFLPKRVVATATMKREPP